MSALPQPIDRTDLPDLGFHYDMPAEDYFGGPGIGSHDLRNILRSPLHFKTWRENPNDPTPAMEFGTAFHTLVLEPDEFEERYEIATERPQGADGRKGKGTIPRALYDHWKAEEAAQLARGKLLLSPDDWDRLHAMRDAIFAHKYASVFLDPDAGPTEVTNFWIDDESPRLCRARFDKLNEAHGPMIVDLKTAADASYTGFAEAASRFGYYFQDAYYSDGYYRTTQQVPQFWFVVVETKPPFGVGVYQLDDRTRQFGRDVYKRALEKYSNCLETNEWPCYPEEPRVIELPAWAYRERIS